MRLPARKLIASAVAIGFILAGASSATADEGLATWYGPGFQGNVMANGQIYDMNDPTTTAANIFPFGTWLKVTNPANGKTVTVQVRDRGGFKHALDLSYAAFALLDDPKKMLIRVLYEVVPGPGPDTKEPVAKAQPQPVAKPNPALPASPQPAPGPGSTSTPAKSQPASQTGYVVEPGDTLFGIASRFGISVADLIKINNLAKADSIVIGQVIRLRGEAVGASAPSSGDSTQPRGANAGPERKTYVLQMGDTLSDIAGRFDTTVEQILRLNNITDPNSVRAGVEIRLAASDHLTSRGDTPSASPRIHVVQVGETLSGIALQYGVNEGVLAEINDLASPDRIVIGQELRLTTDRVSVSAEPARAAREHTVQSGDTLYGIAFKYGTTVEAVLSLNDIADEHLLRLGQVVRLP